ncbi:hypothetical protein Vqi01_31750 [Micromonospora qiuiae]|uniref:Uncharacterized protein n=1 Tax=Micromonospora qiuiae TaxID=502268 RepID=A0ABQ4JCZ0_9ACTN|nr:hypothetical protein Vqi01_31750 [Micromonospora qiuiae]
MALPNLDNPIEVRRVTITRRTPPATAITTERPVTDEGYSPMPYDPSTVNSETSRCSQLSSKAAR